MKLNNIAMAANAQNSFPYNIQASTKPIPVGTNVPVSSWNNPSSWSGTKSASVETQRWNASTSNTPVWSGSVNSGNVSTSNIPVQQYNPNVSWNSQTNQYETNQYGTGGWTGLPQTQTNVFSGPTNAVNMTPLPLIQPKSGVSSGNPSWLNISVPQNRPQQWAPSQNNTRFVLEDSPPPPSSVSRNATVGQLLNSSSGLGNSKGITFDSNTVFKQICGVGNVKGSLNFFSGMCTVSPRDDVDESLSEDSDDDYDEDEEEDTHVTSSYISTQTRVTQSNIESIPVIKSEDEILPQEQGETLEEYNERKKLYDLILKTKYSGYAYIYSQKIAWRGRENTHYAADVLNTIDLIERAIEALSISNTSVSQSNQNESTVKQVTLVEASENRDKNEA